MVSDAAELLTVKEAAEYLRLHPQTVYEMLWAGRLPALRVGGSWRLSRAELAEYLRHRPSEAE